MHTSSVQCSAAMVVCARVRARCICVHYTGVFALGTCARGAVCRAVCVVGIDT